MSYLFLEEFTDPIEWRAFKNFMLISNESRTISKLYNGKNGSSIDIGEGYKFIQPIADKFLFYKRSTRTIEILSKEGERVKIFENIHCTNQKESVKHPTILCRDSNLQKHWLTITLDEGFKLIDRTDILDFQRAKMLDNVAIHCKRGYLCFVNPLNLYEEYSRLEQDRVVNDKSIGASYNLQYFELPNCKLLIYSRIGDITSYDFKTGQILSTLHGFSFLNSDIDGTYYFLNEQTKVIIKTQDGVEFHDVQDLKPRIKIHQGFSKDYGLFIFDRYIYRSNAAEGTVEVYDGNWELRASLELKHHPLARKYFPPQVKMAKDGLLGIKGGGHALSPIRLYKIEK